ncbi:MAG: efflux RND transporter periplasmic adaptor subunit [Verrucomicrobiales bacterium]
MRALIALAILAASLFAAWWMIAHKPEAQRRPPIPTGQTVEVAAVQRQDVPTAVRAHGRVKARTETALVAEVNGRILAVSPAFRNGGFFEKGDVLLELDPSDYEAELAAAREALAQAEADMAEEQARADQAREDWRRLGKGGDPAPLVLREPQLAMARAKKDAKAAQVDRALRDLERTEIRAPYAGRVLAQLADIGQYVRAGTEVGNIYAVDYAEIPLPLRLSDLAFVDLPEQFRGGSAAAAESGGGTPVTLWAEIGGQRAEWQGTIVRTEGTINPRTQEIVAVAQVDDPYKDRGDGHPPLKVGQFVEAEIEGRTLESVFWIPSSAIREGNIAIVISPENTIQRRDLTIAWESGDRSAVTAGLDEGDRLCLTPLPVAAEGGAVKIKGETERRKPD